MAEVLTPLARLNEDETLYQRALVILDAAGQADAADGDGRSNCTRDICARTSGAGKPSLWKRGRSRSGRRAWPRSARAAPRTGPKPLRVGDGVTPPKLQQKTEPQYTDIARMDKLQGKVILILEVGTDGLAHNIQLKQGVGLGLDEKAAEAVSKWSFIPGTRNGEPVTVMATVEVNFKLL